MDCDSKLEKQLREIAVEYQDKYPNVSIVLFTLLASISCGLDWELAMIVRAVAQAQRERLVENDRARRN